MPLSSHSRFLSRSIIPTNANNISVLQFSTSSLAADQFYSLLQKNSGNNNIEKSLAKVNAKLDARCVMDVLRRCCPSHSQMGVRFFIWAGLQSNYRHTSFLYSKACNFLKIKQNPCVIYHVVEAYREEKCLVNIKTIKMVLNLCKEAKLADEALWVLRKMPEFNIRPDTVVYNVIIRLFCEKADMDMAKKLLEEMGLIDLYPDMITYMSLLKGFCDVGRLEDASGLLKVMKGHGCMPNEVTYSTFLDGVCRFGSVDRALELLGEMEKEGGGCSPNVVTYTSVIQCLCEKGRAAEALGVLDRMLIRECAPNRVTISALFKGLCSEGHVAEAYKLIDKVVAAGGVSYGDCYSSLVVTLIRSERHEEAEKLFRKILHIGVRPDSLACSMMIKELCLRQRLLDGFYLYNEIKKLGCLFSIDSDIYSILLVGLCQQNHSVEAANLAGLMLEKRIHLKPPYAEKLVEHLKITEVEELVTQITSIGRSL